MAVVSDLSEFLPYDRILAVAGVSVKGSVPDITACPLCKRPSLTVYQDPQTPRSKWLRCGSCRFSGDTIEAFRRISRSPTLIDAVYAAQKSGLCTATKDRLTPASIKTYVENYPAFRERVTEIWDRLSRGTLEDPSPELIRHAQMKHLWHGWLTGPHKRMTRFLGGAERRTVDDLFLKNFGKRVLPKKGFSPVLAVPYQDVPGRICGLTFIGREKEVSIPIFHDKQESPEGGLAMLDALDGAEKTVYAVSQLDFALQFQRINFASRHSPLKMVVYNDETNNAWDAVNAERVVFWSEEVDWRLFKHVKRFDNGWISTRPRLHSKQSIYDYTRKRTPEVLLHTLDSSAVPWPRFVAEWLMDKSRNPVEIRATLASVLFSSREVDRIVSECPERERDGLRKVLGEVSDEKPKKVFLQQKVVIEREDGWYRTSKDGDSLITDATVKLTHEAVDTGMGEVYWYGEIHYRKHRVVFAGEPFREIDENPVKWLRDRTARVGLGYPRFEKLWAKNFTNLVKSFSNFEVIQVTDRLGLNESGDIIFPHFSLQNGDAAIQDHLPMPDMPALDVQPPVLRDVQAPEPVTAARAAWFASAAAYVMRLLNLTEHPIYVTDGSVKSGISSFMENAGMLRYEMEKGNAEEKQRLIYLSRKFNYPIRLCVSDDILAKLPYESYAPCFVSTPRLTALSLCTQRKGIILRDAPLLDGEEMPPFDDVVWYLAYLQRNQFKTGENDNPVIGTLRNFCQYLEDYLSHFDSGHAGLSASRIRLCSPGKSLIELLALLCLSGKLSLEYYKSDPNTRSGFVSVMERKAVCVDIEGGQVYLHRRAIARACDRMDIPRPNLFEAEKGLSEEGLLRPNSVTDGLLISTELWDDAVRSCRSELNQSP